MRLAVIDLGTNTFHLLIAEINQGAIHILYKTNIAVKLGEGRINENLIVPEAFSRGLKALSEFSDIIREYQVEKLKATATSAIRSAQNGFEFIQAVKNKTGIQIDIISGDEEAEFIYEAVKASGSIQNTCLIVDIGGGSVEFILCDFDQIYWKKSYDIGAARLMQQFFKSDPLSKIDETNLISYLKNELQELESICKQYPPVCLIGSAGAFETFAEVIAIKNNTPIQLNEMNNCSIELSDYREMAKTLIASTHQERAKMPGIIALRVDMIVMAVVLTNYILEVTRIQKIKLSTFDLKMGVLARLAV